MLTRLWKYILVWCYYGTIGGFKGLAQGLLSAIFKTVVQSTDSKSDTMRSQLTSNPVGPGGPIGPSSPWKKTIFIFR